MTMAVIRKGTPAIIGKISRTEEIEYHWKYNHVTEEDLVLGKEDLLCDRVKFHNWPESVLEKFLSIYILLNLQHRKPFTIFKKEEDYLAVCDEYIQWV